MIKNKVNKIFHSKSSKIRNTFKEKCFKQKLTKKLFANTPTTIQTEKKETKNTLLVLFKQNIVC